jgi:hypothetical protein
LRFPASCDFAALALHENNEEEGRKKSFEWSLRIIEESYCSYSSPTKHHPRNMSEEDHHDEEEESVDEEDCESMDEEDEESEEELLTHAEHKEQGNQCYKSKGTFVPLLVTII